MTKHPLTNKKAFKKFREHTVDVTIEHLYTSDGIRAAADWQLEQDQKRLQDFLEEFSYRGHSSEVLLELRAFFNNFKSYMRPTKGEKLQDEAVDKFMKKHSAALTKLADL